MTAAFQATVDGRTHVIEQLIQIRKLLDIQIVFAENDQDNWSYSGDMEYVSVQLSEVELFLSKYKQYIRP